MRIRLIALGVFIFVGVAFWLAFTTRPGNNFNTNQAAVIKEIQNLQRLETASFTIEKIIEGGKPSGNVFRDLLFGDRILLIAHGKVIAGFDLSPVTEDDIKVNGQTVTLTLSPPQILGTSLDSARTRVYDRRQGALSRGDKDLESVRLTNFLSF